LLLDIVPINYNILEHIPSPWYIYILLCADDTLYTGITTDPKRRLTEHNAGVGAKYTQSRRPVTLVYLESAADRSTASRREWEIKQLNRADKLALILN
jgi:putative endonuclease